MPQVGISVKILALYYNTITACSAFLECAFHQIPENTHRFLDYSTNKAMLS